MSAPQTGPTGWIPGQVSGLRDALNRGSWGYTSVNGTKTVEFCPMCMATVPYESDHSPKQVHIEYHVVMAETFRWVTGQLAETIE